MGIAIPQALEALTRVEQTRDLLRFKVDGWSAWTMLRLEVAQYLVQVPTLGSFARVTRGQRLRMALSDMLGITKLRRSRLVLSTLTTSLVDRSPDGRLLDMHFDDLEPLINGAFRLETIASAELLPRRRLAVHPADMTTNAIDFATGVLSRRPPSSEVVDASTAISAALRGDLNLQDLTPAWCAVRLRYFDHAQRLYRRFFERLRTRVLLVADQTQYSIVAGARRAGARVLELQHGISDRTNAAYAWTAYASPYRQSMPLPHRMLLYGDYWRNELGASGFWGDTLRVTGNARLDRFRCTRERKTDETIVVFTAQGFDTVRAAEWLKEALAACGPSLRLFIRLHPVFHTGKSDFVRALGDDPRVTVLEADEQPSTFELVARAHLHVSISSATHYDAVGLGTPTVILPFPMHEALLPMHAAGHALLAQSPAELARFMCCARHLSVTPQTSAFYFEPHAIENTRREIDAAMASPDAIATGTA